MKALLIIIIVSTLIIGFCVYYVFRRLINGHIFRLKNQSPFRNIWTDKDKQEALELLSIFNNVMIAHNIDWCIFFGTLLGYKRHGCMIPWDDDIDVVINTDDKIIKGLKPEFERYGIGLTSYYDIIKIFWLKNEKINDECEWSWPFIDIFVCDDTETITIAEETYKKSAIFPSKRVSFCGMTTNAPNDIDSCLKISFKGDYMNECVSTEWNHRKERPFDRVLKKPCKDLK